MSLAILFLIISTIYFAVLFCNKADAIQNKKSNNAIALVCYLLMTVGGMSSFILLLFGEKK